MMGNHRDEKAFQANGRKASHRTSSLQPLLPVMYPANGATMDGRSLLSAVLPPAPGRTQGQNPQL